MDTEIGLSLRIRELLRCPICRSKLELSDSQLRCVNPDCKSSFPIIDGIPILINESSSVFSMRDFVCKSDTFFKPTSKIASLFVRLMPDISRNFKANDNYDKFAKLLLAENQNPRVLVVGGSILGFGMQRIVEIPAIELIEGDVSFGPRTRLIFDAHDIPFESNSMDGVIVQAVLEHVVDPQRCVEQIHRVLKDGGLVYAETPFMQQVHGGRYDFTRFTHLGHHLLFQKFEEISSGAVAGPGTALAWSYRYFLLSFVRAQAIRSLIGGFVRLSAFWLKYFDYFLIDKASALDGASALYFMGRKTNQTTSPRELIQLYRGAV
jgi:uncharacterized protein YbaR (Trm112 family)